MGHRGTLCVCPVFTFVKRRVQHCDTLPWCLMSLAAVPSTARVLGGGVVGRDGAWVCDMAARMRLIWPMYFSSPAVRQANDRVISGFADRRTSTLPSRTLT